MNRHDGGSSKKVVFAFLAGLMIGVYPYFLYTSQLKSLDSNYATLKSLLTQVKGEVENVSTETKEVKSGVSQVASAVSLLKTLSVPDEDEDDYTPLESFAPMTCKGHQRKCGNWNVEDPSTHSQLPDICSYISNLGCEGYFFGLFGITKRPDMSKSDIMFLDFIFSQYQAISNFTELGTATGITALYMGMVSRIRGGSLETFCIGDHRDQRSRDAWLPNMRFILADVLATENEEVVVSLKRSVQFALMDNGNKAQEINTYCKYLPVGSVLLTHDFGVEVHWDGIKDEVTRRGFIPIYEEMALHLNTHVRAWYRKSLSNFQKYEGRS